MSVSTPFHHLIDALNKLGLSYLVGGSFASTYHGVPRATNDADLLIRIPLSAIAELARVLGPDFYLDVPFASECVTQHRSFNILHKATAYKFDLFPAFTPFHESELDRAVEATFDFMREPLLCRIATVEDIVLAKLVWYRLGGCVSDRQWSDITNAIASTEILDRSYLERWAKELQVSDLLQRVLSD